ncbi:MAG TPA: PEP-CTERM sorting domain-containing protein [Pirellulales bacterium]
MRHRSTIAAASYLLLAICGSATANSIGLNFTATRFGGGPYPILPNESAGLVPQTNWNNTNPLGNGSTADVASPVAGTLVDNTGAATGVTVQWFNGNAEVNSSGGNTTPDERLFRGAVEGQFFGSPSPQLEVTVSNVPYAHYEVIAYVVGFGFAADSSVRLGDQEFFYTQSSNFTTDGFIKATATDYADRTLATYAEFDNLTGSTFTLELIHQGGNRPAIDGFQIVATPEPSSWVLIVLGCGLLGLHIRQRRK